MARREKMVVVKGREAVYPRKIFTELKISR